MTNKFLSLGCLLVFVFNMYVSLPGSGVDLVDANRKKHGEFMDKCLITSNV